MDLERPRLAAAQLLEEARARRAQNNFPAALSRYERCVELLATLGEEAWLAEVETELGHFHQEQYNLSHAVIWYRRAADRLQGRAYEAHFRLGQVYHLGGQLPDAEGSFRQALAAQPNLAFRAQVMAALGQVLCEQGRVEEGLAQQVAAYEWLRAESEAGAERVREQLRGWRERLGRARFTAAVEGATDDPALRQELRRF